MKRELERDERDFESHLSNVRMREEVAKRRQRAKATKRPVSISFILELRKLEHKYDFASVRGLRILQQAIQMNNISLTLISKHHLRGKSPNR